MPPKHGFPPAPAALTLSSQGRAGSGAVPAWAPFSVSSFLPGSRSSEPHTPPCLCVLGTRGRPRGRTRGPGLRELPDSGEEEADSRTDRHSALGSPSANVCELSASRAAGPDPMSQMMGD